MAIAGMTAEQEQQYYAAIEEDRRREECERDPLYLTRSAFWYVQKLEWPVFPCQPRGKQPLTAHGLKDASTDLNQIHRWWTANPDANLATPTGIFFDVIDIDGAAGTESNMRLKVEGFWDFQPEYARSATPRGQHVLIPLDGGDGEGGKLTNHVNVRGYPGIDIRGFGGYIILPPSVHETGRRYGWINRPVPIR